MSYINRDEVFRILREYRELASEPPMSEADDTRLSLLYQIEDRLEELPVVDMVQPMLIDEIEFIDKQIRSAEISLYQAQQRPNTPMVDITNLERKLDILHNIRNVLVERSEKDG